MLTIAVLVTAWTFYRPAPGGAGPVATRYYMDTKTGQLFVAPKELPPILAPSGAKDAQGNGTGVLAFVFSCGDCDKEADRFTGFLESTEPAQVEPERRDQLAELLVGPGSGMEQVGSMFKGVIVAAADAPDKWVARETPEAQQIVTGVASHCGDARMRPRRCTPKAP